MRVLLERIQPNLGRELCRLELVASTFLRLEQRCLSEVQGPVRFLLLLDLYRPILLRLLKLLSISSSSFVLGWALYNSVGVDPLRSEASYYDVSSLDARSPVLYGSMDIAPCNHEGRGQLGPSIGVHADGQPQRLDARTS